MYLLLKLKDGEIMSNRKKCNLELPKLRIEVEYENKIKKKKFILKSLLLVFIFMLFISSIYSVKTPINENVLISGTRKVLASVGIYTEEIKNVEIESDDFKNQEGGAWHIDKSADWIGLNKAQIKFEVDTVARTNDFLKDVIIVLDVSGSMSGSAIDRVKKDTKELIEVLLSNNNNRVALISFNGTSKVLSEFSNDREMLLNLVENLFPNGNTNYNAALLNVDGIMDGYDKKEDRDLVMLFLTDGYPNVDTPNQVATYKVLKDKYPYMVINGIQYEMGKSLIQEIIDISDNQYIADMESLNNVLFEASIDPEFYEYFEIVDYIDKDYWYVENESDIKVDKGKIKLEVEDDVQKVIWSFPAGVFRTGSSANMTINVKLKEQYVGTKGFYPTNEKETVKYKLLELEEKNDSFSKTPVLKSKYKVIYDNNLPIECGKSDFLEEEHYAFENVLVDKGELTCDGYAFKGWEIATQEVTKINDEVFLMPSKDVIVRGIWSKQLIVKSMDGEVKQRETLYNKIEEEYLKSSDYIEKYTGLTTSLGDKNIYYYYGNNAKNNIVFANYCWKIVRTTDTGGIKLLYNGVPSDAGICDNSGFDSQLTSVLMNNSSRGTSPINNPDSFLASAGYMYNNIYSAKRLSTSSTTEYKFANSFIYDSETDLYTLIDTDISSIKSGIDIVSSYSELANNHYSCLNDSGVCQKVAYFYFVESKSSILYIELTGGKSAEDAVKEMLYDDNVNKNDSTIKKAIDYWYENNMIDYTGYLEDTIWCNDRSIYNPFDNGWNPNGGDLNTEMAFGSYGNYDSLICPNKIDRFTVDVSNGNGALKYPVGLLTEQELTLSSLALVSNSSYWSLSPYFFSGDHMLYVHDYGDGQLTHYYSWVGRGVRPSVSLNSTVSYDFGEGTIDNPYVIS